MEATADNTKIGVSAIESAHGNQRYQDGLSRLLDWEAREAQAAGNHARAWHLFERLVQIDPKDAHALRELGRSAAAVGEFATAERSLNLCNTLRDGALDPELHFIRGEALLAMGRRHEGMEELAIAEREIAIAPQSLDAQRWMARIHVMRGQGARAVTIYKKLLSQNAGAPTNSQLLVSLAEAHIVAGQTTVAKALLRSHLKKHEDPRAQDLLAWVLELRGDIAEEVVLRQLVGRRWDGADAQSLVAYARSLERAGHFHEAVSAYKQARERGNLEVADAIARLEAKLGPEVMATGELRNFPTGVVSDLAVGTMASIGSRVRVSFTAALQSIVDDRMIRAQSSGSAASMVRFGDYDEAGLGAVGWQDSSTKGHVGGSAVLHSNPARSIRMFAQAQYNVPWNESAETLREDGATSGLELQLYSNIFTPKLVLLAGGRWRHLVLNETVRKPEQIASERLGVIGIDWIAHADFGNGVRGHFMDRKLLRPSNFSDSIVLSFRHYEVASNGGLQPRLFLVDRSRVEEVSASATKVITNGVIAVGATGGLGYDQLREARLWRVGGRLLWSLSWATRMVLSFDIAREHKSGFSGKRSASFIGFHANL